MAFLRAASQIVVTSPLGCNGLISIELCRQRGTLCLRCLIRLLRHQMSELLDYPNPFRLPVKVLPEHIDGLQHVNNAVYVQWCEAAAWAHSEHLGLGLSDYKRLDRAMAIAHAEYDYQRPAHLGDELEVCTWLTQSDGRMSMIRRFQLLHGDVTLVRGSWNLVCIALTSGRPARMPADFKAVYEPALVGQNHGG